jgi:hypothetical protein
MTETPLAGVFYVDKLLAGPSDGSLSSPWPSLSDTQTDGAIYNIPPKGTNLSVKAGWTIIVKGSQPTDLSAAVFPEQTFEGPITLPSRCHLIGGSGNAKAALA